MADRSYIQVGRAAQANSGRSQIRIATIAIVASLIVATLVVVNHRPARPQRVHPLRVASAPPDEADEGPPDTMPPVFVPPDGYKRAAEFMGSPKSPAPTTSTTQAPPRPRPHQVCPSSWAQSGFDAAQTHDNAEECTLTAAAVGAQRPTPRWRSSLPGPLVGSPAVARGRVVVASADQTVTAFDAANGRVLWKAPVAHVRTGPSVDGGRVLVGGADGTLSALDESSGRALWATAMLPNNDGIISITVSNGRVYVAGGEGLAAADEAGGRLAWQTVTHNVVLDPPAVVGSTVVAGGRWGAVAYGPDLFAFDADTGAELWSKSVNLMAITPVGWGTKVVYGAYGDGISVADPRTGAVERTISTGGSDGGLALAGTKLIMAGGGLTAIDLATGRQLWTTYATPATSVPTIAGDVAWVSPNNGIAVDLSTGREIAWFPEWGSNPAVAGGSLYVPERLTDTWSLAAYGY